MTSTIYTICGVGGPTSSGSLLGLRAAVTEKNSVNFYCSARHGDNVFKGYSLYEGDWLDRLPIGKFPPAEYRVALGNLDQSICIRTPETDAEDAGLRREWHANQISRKEQEARDDAAAHEAQRRGARTSANEARQDAHNDLLARAGQGHLTGRARRQMIAHLHSQRGRKEYGLDG